MIKINADILSAIPLKAKHFEAFAALLDELIQARLLCGFHDIQDNIWQLPLDALTQGSPKPKVNGKQVRLVNLIQEKFPLFTVVAKGNNFNGLITKVSLDPSRIQVWDNRTGTLLFGDRDMTTLASQARFYTASEVFELAYPELAKTLAGFGFSDLKTELPLLLTSYAPEHQECAQILRSMTYEVPARDGPALITGIDFAEINTNSLEAYLDWKENRARIHPGQEERHDRCVNEAKLVLKIAQATGGYLPQQKMPSEHGRIYYRGTSSQSVPRDVREAMFGGMWEYDLYAATFVWRFGYCARIRAELDPAFDPVHTQLFLMHRDTVFEEVQRAVWPDVAVEEFYTGLIKRAFAAVGFGARTHLGQAYYDKGTVKTNAIADIIKDRAARKRFLEHEFVQGFINEQKQFAEYILRLEAAALKEPTEQGLFCKNVRDSKSSMFSYLFQHFEKSLIDVVQEMITQHSPYNTVIARVHDAIVLEHRLGAETLQEINAALQTELGNEHWLLKGKQYKEYHKLVDAQEIDAHKALIAEQEREVQGYGNRYAVEFKRRELTDDEYERARRAQFIQDVGVDNYAVFEEEEALIVK